MLPHHPDDSFAGRPDLLAAYVDGELDADTAARLEAWLADHPEAAADVKAQREVLRLWEAGAPPETSETRWDAVRAGIEAGLAASAPVGVRRLRVLWWAAGLASAAALALAVYLARGPAILPQMPPPELLPPDDQVAEEPFPVVSPEDVVITSLDEDDRKALVVGGPPVGEPLALAGPGEVQLEQVRTDVQGMTPQMPRDAVVPMIHMVPAGPAPDAKGP